MCLGRNAPATVLMVHLKCDINDGPWVCARAVVARNRNGMEKVLLASVVQRRPFQDVL